MEIHICFTKHGWDGEFVRPEEFSLNSLTLFDVCMCVCVFFISIFNIFGITIWGEDFEDFHAHSIPNTFR